MTFSVFSKNGEILPIAEAHVSLMSLEYTYGYGVYETIRVRKRQPLFIADHLLRLRISCETLSLTHRFSDDVIANAIRSLIAALSQDTYNIKILLIGASSSADTALYILASNPQYPEKSVYRDGVHTITKQFERAFPQAKSLNMLQSYIAYRDAKQENAYDALLINRHGEVTEGTRTNFFVLDGMTIVSPPAAVILLGVTRKHVLDVAVQQGFTYREEPIKLQHAHEFDAAFLTSTSTKIVPIRSIGSKQCNPIPETLRALMSAFDRFHDSVA
jgi:branched-subunit amino acid aminotransferase/4-amino-4-deoxychorismate lyase